MERIAGDQTQKENKSEAERPQCVMEVGPYSAEENCENCENSCLVHAV